jgi:PTH1 family peptidyl-tRNA hydrolase
MKLIAGLGNPGSRYAKTRHNVGFEVLAELARRWQAPAPKRQFQAEIADARFGSEKVLLVAPQTYMNLSGDALVHVVKFYQVALSDILVVCDDMNLPTGKLRFRGQGSAGGQKGLKHIIDVLGSDAIPRLRIGIGRPPAQMDAVDYVLSKFRADEAAEHDESILRAALGVEAWIEKGIGPAMNEFNGSEPEPGTEQKPAP